MNINTKYKTLVYESDNNMRTKCSSIDPLPAFNGGNLQSQKSSAMNSRNNLLHMAENTYHNTIATDQGGDNFWQQRYVGLRTKYIETEKQMFKLKC